MAVRGADERQVGLALVTVIAPVSWGTTYVTVSELLPPDRPFWLSAGRVAPAALLLLALAGLRAGHPPAAGDRRRLMLLSTTNFAVFFPLLIVAASRLPGGVAAALGGLQPALVLGVTAILDRQRPRSVDLAVSIVAAVGVALVVLRLDGSIDPVGVLAGVGANCSFAGGVVLTRRLGHPSDRLADTGWQLAAATVVLVPIALLVEGSPPRLGARGLVGIGHLSVVGTALAFSMWFRGIGRLAPVVPPLLGLAAPITGVLAGWLLLGQGLSLLQLVGLALVLTAITHATLARNDGRASRPERSKSSTSVPQATTSIVVDVGDRRRPRSRGGTPCTPSPSPTTPPGPTGSATRSRWRP